MVGWTPQQDARLPRSSRKRIAHFRALAQQHKADLLRLLGGGVVALPGGDGTHFPQLALRRRQPGDQTIPAGPLQQVQQLLESIAAAIGILAGQQGGDAIPSERFPIIQ